MARAERAVLSGAGLEPGPYRQPGGETRLHHPAAMLGRSGGLRQQQLHPALGEDAGLLVQVRAVGAGVEGGPSGLQALGQRLAVGQDAVVRYRAGDAHRASVRGPSARFLGEHHRAQVQLPGQIPQPDALQTVPRSGVRIGGHDVDAGADVALVHEPHRVGVRMLCGAGPRAHPDRHPQRLQLGADRAVEEQDLAALDTFPQLPVVTQRRFSPASVLHGRRSSRAGASGAPAAPSRRAPPRRKPAPRTQRKGNGSANTSQSTRPPHDTPPMPSCPRASASFTLVPDASVDASVKRRIHPFEQPTP